MFCERETYRKPKGLLWKIAVSVSLIYIFLASYILFYSDHNFEYPILHYFGNRTVSIVFEDNRTCSISNVSWFASIDIDDFSDFVNYAKRYPMNLYGDGCVVLLEKYKEYEVLIEKIIPAMIVFGAIAVALNYILLIKILAEREVN